jgi:hypothetical protein
MISSRFIMRTGGDWRRFWSKSTEETRTFKSTKLQEESLWTFHQKCEVFIPWARTWASSSWSRWKRTMRGNESTLEVFRKLNPWNSCTLEITLWTNLTCWESQRRIPFRLIWIWRKRWRSSPPNRASPPPFPSP